MGLQPGLWSVEVDIDDVRIRGTTSLARTLTFHPFMLFSTRTWGLNWKACSTRGFSSSALLANPEPRPPDQAIVGIQDTGYRIQDTGYGIQGMGYGVR